MPGAFGTYRGVYTSLVDDPDYQSLSPNARHVFQTMRLSDEIGPGCIWRAYLEPISKRTGYTMKIVEQSLDELREGGWIEWDGIIIWIKNGLRYDPTFKLCDEKHKKSLLRRLSMLPKREIVVNFCKYYDLVCPFDAPSKGLTKVSYQNQNQEQYQNQNQEQVQDQKRTLSSPDNGLDFSLFDYLWTQWPSNKGPKDLAKKEYKAQHPPPDFLDAFRLQLAHKQECDRRKRFCPEFPHVFRWLKQRRWEEDLPLIPETQAEQLWRESQEEKRQ
jgi:hypothetical protein